MLRSWGCLLTLTAGILLLAGCSDKGKTPDSESKPPQAKSAGKTDSTDCPPGAVARVDDHPIMREDAERRARISLRNSGVLDNDTDYAAKLKRAHKGAVDLLVRAYILQQAATGTVEVSTAELANELYSWKAKVPSKESWDKFLGSNGLTEEQFVDILRKDLQIRATMQKAAAHGVPRPTPDEARQFFDTKTLAFAWPYRVRYDEIRWNAPPDLPDASHEKARTGMETLAAEMGKNPALFDEILARVPDGKHWGPIGRRLPYQNVKEVPKPIEEALHKLVQGEISPVIKTKSGYSLIRIASLRESYDSAYKGILETLYADRVSQNLDNWIKGQERKHKAAICDEAYYLGEVGSPTSEQKAAKE